MNRFLIILSMLLVITACNNTRLIVPLATTHTMSGDYNENNPGVGFECKNNSNIVFSAVYIEANSFDQPSIYLGLSGETLINKDKTMALSAGLVVANGYQDISNFKHGLAMLPVLGYRYKWLRLVTTIPAGHLFCPDDKECSDMISLQAVIEF